MSGDHCLVVGKVDWSRGDWMNIGEVWVVYWEKMIQES